MPTRGSFGYPKDASFGRLGLGFGIPQNGKTPEMVCTEVVLEGVPQNLKGCRHYGNLALLGPSVNFQDPVAFTPGVQRLFSTFLGAIAHRKPTVDR